MSISQSWKAPPGFGQVATLGDGHSVEQLAQLLVVAKGLGAAEGKEWYSTSCCRGRRCRPTPPPPTPLPHPKLRHRRCRHRRHNAIDCLGLLSHHKTYTCKRNNLQRILILQWKIDYFEKFKLIWLFFQKQQFLANSHHQTFITIHNTFR